LVFKPNLLLMCELPIKIKLAVSGEVKVSIRSRIPMFKALFWLFIVLVIFYSPLFAQQEIYQKKVLILASYSPAGAGAKCGRGVA